MAIRMQGAWTVTVKAKNAAFQQRFLVEGADSGNGTYAGDISTPAVFVTGADWNIRIEHNAGSGWLDSDDQITFPAVNAGQYQFDIESNDTGPDADFNDLILTCSMPVTATDFLIYGNASSYRGPCIFNPCFPRFVVIDSVAAFNEALRYPALVDAIRELYPERLRPRPPEPDPPPFRPMIFSLDGETPIPVKEDLQIRLRSLEPAIRGEGEAPAKREAARATTIAAVESVPISAARTTATSVIDRIAVSALADRLRLFCDVDPLAGVVLRFQEYDRTAAELAGGPYTGDGVRENLGVTVTDRNGNYVFRFSRTIPEFFDEAALDTGSGESTVTQSAPDIIVQLIDVMQPGTVLWESAPYFNIPTFRRINICIPETRLHPSQCIEGQVLEALGNIWIGPPLPGPVPPGEPPGYGARVGLNNSLGVEGRITARNTNGPQARCAAWFGRVDLFGCFLDHPSVTHYTIRYRELGSGDPWTMYSQELRHPLIALAATPGYDGELIGPQPVSLHVDGGPAVLAPAYEDIETNVLYVSTHRNRRAQIRTRALSVSTPGPVQFWIEGYDGTGSRVPGAEDSFTMFIDNSIPFLDVDNTVTMLGTSLGNCAKFKLPSGQPGAPLTVKFKADQAQGFLNNYELFMRKGAIGTFNVTPPPPAGPPFRLRSYTHGDDLVCNQFRGTFDDTTADLVTGYVTIDLEPASGSWLEADENFCAFSVNLTGSMRVTNGYGGRAPNDAIPVLIGIEAD